MRRVGKLSDLSDPYLGPPDPLEDPRDVEDDDYVPTWQWWGVSKERW